MICSLFIILWEENSDEISYQVVAILRKQKHVKLI